MNPAETEFMTGIRRALLDRAREHGRVCFDPSTRRCGIVRDTLWWAIALAHSDDAADRALADALWRELRAEDATHTPATMLAVLLCMPGRLPGEAVSHLESELRRLLPLCADAEWHDGNVNHPVAAWCALGLAGERFGDALAVRLAARKLHRFRAVVGDRRHADARTGVRRQSQFPEYQSPTYTPLTLCMLALAAAHARDADLRAIARFLEERMWIDIALHWHAPMAQPTGPFSRAYVDDSLGMWSPMHCAIAAAFECELPLDPSVAVDAGHHSALLQNALTAIIPFHPTAEARRLAFEKPFPLSIRALTFGEAYHENREGAGFDSGRYPGGWSELVTWATGRHALGTASLPYVNAGHADAVHARILRTARLGARGEQRALFARGVFNDAEVLQAGSTHVTRGATDATYLYEEGRTCIVQHEGRAIVCYTPKRTGAPQFRGFRVDIVIGWDVPFDRLLVDGRERTSFPVRTRASSPIVFLDGRTVGAIMPLAIAPAVSELPVLLRERRGCLIISLINHDGDAREVDAESLARWRNGFYIHLEDLADGDTLDRFAARMRMTKVDDTADPTGVRRVRVEAAGYDALELHCDPGAERILHAASGHRDLGIARLECVAGMDRAPLLDPMTIYGREAWERHHGAAAG